MSREVYSQEALPAPPHGYVLIKFLTRLAKRPAGIETVSLEREGANWKVVGYWIAWVIPTLSEAWKVPRLKGGERALDELRKGPSGVPVKDRRRQSRRLTSYGFGGFRPSA